MKTEKVTAGIGGSRFGKEENEELETPGRRKPSSMQGCSIL